MSTTRMSSKGQVVLPKAVREMGSVSEALAGLGREIWRGIDAVKYVRKERSGWER